MARHMPILLHELLIINCSYLDAGSDLPRYRVPGREDVIPHYCRQSSRHYAFQSWMAELRSQPQGFDIQAYRSNMLKRHFVAVLLIEI